MKIIVIGIVELYAEISSNPDGSKILLLINQRSSKTTPKETAHIIRYNKSLFFPNNKNKLVINKNKMP